MEARVLPRSAAVSATFRVEKRAGFKLQQGVVPHDEQRPCDPRRAGREQTRGQRFVLFARLDK